MDKNNNHPDDSLLQERRIKRHTVLSSNLQTLSDDLCQIFESVYGVKLTKQEKTLFEQKSSGSLYYWLGVVYDEAFIEVKNLELALNTSKAISNKLRRDSESNIPIVLALSESLVTSLPTKISEIDKAKDFSSQVDGFFEHVRNNIAKGLTPYPPASRPPTESSFSSSDPNSTSPFSRNNKNNKKTP
jgi:hypothetical protein